MAIVRTEQDGELILAVSLGSISLVVSLGKYRFRCRAGTAVRRPRDRLNCLESRSVHIHPSLAKLSNQLTLLTRSRSIGGIKTDLQRHTEGFLRRMSVCVFRPSRCLNVSPDHSFHRIISWLTCRGGPSPNYSQARRPMASR